MPFPERLTRLFESFASTLVEVSLPKVRAWLQARAGQEADIASASFEDGAVHLEGMRVPLGPRGLLLLERASFTVAPALGAPELTLRAFAGRVAFGRDGDPLVFTADAAFTGGPAPQRSPSAGADADAGGHTWADGELTVSNAAWTLSHGEGERRPLVGRARLRVTTRTWALEGGEATTGEARIRLDARGVMQGDAGIEGVQLEVTAARAGHFVDALAAILGRGLERELPLPWEALVDGVLSWDAETGGRADLALRSAATQLLIGAHVGASRELGGACAGALGAEEWAERARVPATWRPASEDRVRVDARLGGTLEAPHVTAILEIPALRFRLGAPRYVPPEELRDVRVEAEAGVEPGSTGVRVRARGGAEAGGASLAFESHRSPAGAWSASLRIGDLRGSTVARIARAAGALDPLDVPPGARLSLALELPEGARAWSGRAAATTPQGTALALEELTLSFDEREGATPRVSGTLTGELSFQDALAARMFPVGIRPAPCGTVAGSLAVSGAAHDLRLVGDVRADRVELVVASRPDVPPFPLSEVRGALEVNRREIRCRQVEAALFGARARAEAFVDLAGGSDEPRLRVSFGEVGADALEALGRLSTSPRLKPRVAPAAAGAARPADELWIPRDVRASGQLSLAPDLSLSGTIALETAAGTALLLALSLSPAPHLRLDGSRLRGRLATADALVAGLFDTPIRPLPGGTAMLEASLRGPVDDAVLSGRASAAGVRVGMPAAPDTAVYLLDDLSALFLVDARRIVWNKLSAHAYGGALRSHGLLGYGGAFTGIQAQVSWDDVQIARVPLDARGRVAGAFVTGALSGALRFERRGDASAVLSATGHARIEGPAYPAVLDARDALARYGLDAPSAAGVEPATCALRLDARGWTLADLRATIPAASVRAEVRVGLDGSLGGAARVGVASDYLGSSAWLAVPAWLAGDLEVPVLLGGTLQAPSVDGRLGDAFERLLVTNRVTSTVVGAMGTVYEAIAGEPLVPRRPDREAPAGAPRSPEGEDAIIRRMIQEGADWDSIELELARSGPRRPPPRPDEDDAD